MMSNKDFIGQMVQETISIENDDKSNLLSFTNENSFEVKATYDSKRFCYVIHNKREAVEVPENWGPFKNRVSSVFHLSKFDDKDNFVEIISVFFKRDLHSIKVVLQNTQGKFPINSAA
jgi:hypothetical protein